MAFFGKRTAETPQVLQLPIDGIAPNPNQPRRTFSPAELDELANSIAQVGILQPLTVRALEHGWELVAGERRLRAAAQAGLETVPCLVIQADEAKSTLLALVENVQRQDLDFWEEALALDKLIVTCGLSQEEAAQQVGKSRPAVANALRLLTLPDPVHLLLEEGKLSAGHARAILAVPSGELQKKLAQKVIAEELSVRQTEALAKRLAAEPREAAEPKSAAGPDLSIYLREAEKTLATRFGRKVHIINGRKKGKIELEYYNPEDLNTLLELLEQLPSAGKGGVSL